MTNDPDRLSALIDGALSDEDARALAAALEENPEMAETLARLRRTDDLVRAAVPLEDPLPAALLERLGLADAPSNVIDLAEVRARAAAPAEPTLRLGSWRRLAMIAATLCAVVIGLGWIASLRPIQPNADYRTLSSAAQPGEIRPNALVVFARPLSRAEASALVARAGARIVGAPTPAGAWKLAVPAAERDAVLARLRAAPGVAMAEPLDGGAP